MANAASNTPKTQTLGTSPPQVSLYKAALVTLFLLLPLLPSLAPDFINQTIHGRSWEVFQLIFVGIAVSYGLFSKKNDEADKDHSSKIDNAQTYVSKLLQVSSVFDDESENQTVIEVNNFQTLSSPCYRGEPVVVVAKENPVVSDENGVVSQVTQKPLLLPVRSLKQRASTPNEVDLADHESGRKDVSRSGSRRFTSSNSRKSRNGDLGRVNVQKSEEGVEENFVLRSPIPWRSRSGKMEVKENGDVPPSFTASASSMEEPGLNRLDKARSFKSSGLHSSPRNLSPSPSESAKKLSPSTSFSSKTSEDRVRKKGFSSPPPAPPPPPPHFLKKSVLIKSNSAALDNAESPEKLFRRSAKSVPETEMDEVPSRTRSGFWSMAGRVQNDEPSEWGMTAEKESDEDSEIESEEDEFEGAGGKDAGPDVDKKADEFIAKFREQIRLQRIESIRRTTARRAEKNLGGGVVVAK